MKRAQRAAMRQKARSKWDYVEGISEEDEIAELLDWHDDYQPPMQRQPQQMNSQGLDGLPF